MISKGVQSSLLPLLVPLLTATLFVGQLETACGQTAAPTPPPTPPPTTSPTSMPSSIPSEAPSTSSQPSSQPSSIPSEAPSTSSQPSEAPSTSSQPSSIPSSQPSSMPSESPSSQPSSIPSSQPSSMPSEQPSSQPSSIPSSQPSSMPSEQPSSQPSSQPSAQPSAQPSEAPSANPSQGCSNTRTDCGWGIFNPWTCSCDCPVGICLDNNEQCYHPCRETIHTNPWAGCSPGWDCPWFPDPDFGHCISELHQANNFEIYRTAKECCDEHYASDSSCVRDSKAEHDPFPWPIHFPGTVPWTRPFAPSQIEGSGTNNEHHWGTEAGQGRRWFPDLINQLNCVVGNHYEEWMTNDGFEEDYLFMGSEDCCEKWYPDKVDCPSVIKPVDPEAEDEPWHSAPYSMDNYFYPDFGEASTCRYGRDYPAWMGINGYEKHYLFRTGDMCCDKYFKNGGGGACPMESNPTDQIDYFWTSYQENLSNSADMPVRYNHTFYPDINGGFCVNGTDYPEWMGSDIDYKRLYLFKTNEGCCTQWFTTDRLQSCITDLVQGVYLEKLPCHLNRPDQNTTGTPCDELLPDHANDPDQPIVVTTKWYPDLDGLRCKNDGYMEDWMLHQDYQEWYLFNTQAQCCSAFGFC